MGPAHLHEDGDPLDVLVMINRKEVEHFFSIYKDLEGRRAEIQRREKSELAAEVILDSIRRYEKKYLQHGP
ncbi:MAG: inorganic diphosphatase [Gemmatimonadaceae bacterium]